jgi:uncharacterized protein
MRYLAVITTQVLGILFIVLGIVGLFLPFLQGIFFLIIGLYLLSFSMPKLRAKIHQYLSRYPKLDGWAHKIDNAIRRIFRLPPE